MARRRCFHLRHAAVRSVLLRAGARFLRAGVGFGRGAFASLHRFCRDDENRAFNGDGQASRQVRASAQKTCACAGRTFDRDNSARHRGRMSCHGVTALAGLA